MNQFKISTQLSLLVGVMSALLLLMGGLGLYGTREANAALRTVYEDRMVKLGYVMDLQRLLYSNRLAITMAIAYPDKYNDMMAMIAGNRDAVVKAYSSYVESELTEKEKELLAQFDADRKVYADEGTVPALKAVKDGDVQTARKIEQEKIVPWSIKTQQGIQKSLIFSER